MTQDQFNQAEKLKAIVNECELAIKMLKIASNQIITLAELSDPTHTVKLQELDNAFIQKSINFLYNYAEDSKRQIARI